jgi:nucleoid-associated protein YgaU
VVHEWEAVAAQPGDALVRAVVMLAALLVGRWVLVTVLTAVARVPGLVGRSAAAAVRGLRPGVGRRLVAAALGLGAPAVLTLSTLPQASAVAVDRPATDVARRPVLPSTPALAGPASRATATPARSTARATAVVVVRRGDTLWDIARRHLPASATPGDIARAWPRWYAANRAAIGPDPARLRPGTRLRHPDRRPAGTPASSHDRSPATGTDPGAVARSLDPDRR